MTTNVCPAINTFFAADAAFPVPEKLLAWDKRSGILSGTQIIDEGLVAQIGSTFVILPEDCMITLSKYIGQDIVLVETDRQLKIRRRGGA